jgi:hypothetical protein
MKPPLNYNPENKVAVIITGTFRETKFILDIFSYFAGKVEYDIYLVLRHVNSNEESRIGAIEKDYNLSELIEHLPDNAYICELPSINVEKVKSKFVIPTGPTNLDREAGMLSMLYGVSTATKLLEATLRDYSHVMKTRTDYLPWLTPWIDGMLLEYQNNGEKIIIDGLATKPIRYPDRLDIPWQGSISDLFSFSNVEQYFQLWDIIDILPEIWTGVAETTLFRSAISKITGDVTQTHRRNDSFLNKHFFWEHNETGQSFNFLRFGVLSKELKEIIVNLSTSKQYKLVFLNKLIRTTYDYIGYSVSKSKKDTPFIIGKKVEVDLLKTLIEKLPNNSKDEYLKLCKLSIENCIAI